MNLDSGERATILHAIYTALRANPDAFTEGDLAILESVTKKLEEAN